MYRVFLYLIILMFPCLLSALTKGTDQYEGRRQGKALVLLSEVTLPFAEPSGIAWSEALQCMWVVGGDDQHIYKLDTNGSVIQQLPFAGTDLEGIAFDEMDSTLWVVDEARKEIVHLDLLGSVLMRKTLFYPSGKKNKGPEGITIGPEHLIYIVNEREPSVVMQLDRRYKVKKSIQLNFALDYSDISYDKSSNTFLIISDKSQAFYVWIEKQGVLCEYRLPNKKNEGIAYDRKRNVYYIVNDETAKLYRYGTQE
jgi:uncharacterized protein YjiK